MNVSLTPQLEAFVKRKVSTGRYNSVSEVVREALRLLEEHDAVQAAKLEALREEIQAGRASLDRGEGQSLDLAAIKARARQARPQS